MVILFKKKEQKILKNKCAMLIWVQALCFEKWSNLILTNVVRFQKFLLYLEMVFHVRYLSNGGINFQNLLLESKINCESLSSFLEIQAVIMLTLWKRPLSLKTVDKYCMQYVIYRQEESLVYIFLWKNGCLKDTYVLIHHCCVRKCSSQGFPVIDAWHARSYTTGLSNGLCGHGELQSLASRRRIGIRMEMLL